LRAGAGYLTHRRSLGGTLRNVGLGAQVREAGWLVGGPAQ